MNPRFSLYPWFLIVCISVLAQCKPKTTEPEQESFDKEAMLANIGSNVIASNYALWKAECDGLKTAFSAFEEIQSDENLAELKSSASLAYLSWNHCSVFEFGPAADQNLRLKLNTFPTDTAQVEVNLKNESVDLNTAQNAHAKGFPAIEYLLNSGKTADQFDVPSLNYLKANIDLVALEADDVASKWTDYKVEFAANTASSVGSPIGLLINQINYEFELLKNARIGIPMGKKTLGISQVEKLEGYYSDQSRALFLANLQGIEDAFSGRSGIGFDDYLDAQGIKKDNQNLSAAILNGFQKVRDSLEDIPSLKEAIEKDESTLEPTYAAIQQLLILLKTDLPSQLGVQITYQDNDGD
jgi:uncharacterized protein